VLDSQGRILERDESLRIGTSSTACNASEVNSQPLSFFGATCGIQVNVLLRPMKGDHIHIAFSIYIDGLLVDLPFDRPQVESIYEGNQYQSPEIVAYHILQTFPHVGIHSGHSDWYGYGLIHIHIGTAQAFFHETEGLGANLDAYLEQVGIWVGERTSKRYPYHTMLGNAPNVGEITMDFPANVDGQPFKVGGSYTNDGRQNVGGIPIEEFDNCPRHPRDYQTPEENRVLIKDTEQKKWRLYIWDFVQDAANNNSAPDRIIEDGIGRVWLNQNQAVFVLSFENRSNNVPPRPPPAQLRYLDNGQGEYEFNVSQFYTLGFDGWYYSMPNARGRLPGYPPSNPLWQCDLRENAN